MRLMRVTLILVATALLAACSDGGLRELQKPGEGPDEFRILPGKPLQSPENFTNLPTPTPGQGNITDQQPLQESVAALGGRRSADDGRVPSADNAVINHASRFGRDSAIRTNLATEDEAYRARRGRFTWIRISKVDRYNQVYKPYALDAVSELRRWRRAGAKTPSTPYQ